MTLIDFSAKDLAILLLGIIFSSELLIQLPLFRYVAYLTKLLKKVLKILRSTYISDRQKERVILRYAGKLFFYSLTVATQLVLAFIPFSLALRFVTKNLEEMIATSLDLATILCATIITSLYLFLRMRWHVLLFENR